VNPLDLSPRTVELPTWQGASVHVLADDDDADLTPAAKVAVAKVWAISGSRWARVVANGYHMDEIRARAARQRWVP
jgi:hypothetical protein